MKTRIITAVVTITAVLILLAFRTSFVIPLVIAALTAVGGYEIFKATENAERKIFFAVTELFLVVMPFVARGYLPFLSTQAWMLLYAFAFATCLVVRFDPPIVPKQFVCAGMALCMANGFSCLQKMLADEKYGLFLFLTAAFCAWMCDTGAYFVGSFFGKRKLSPILSPKKTVEGALGGIVVCVISVMLLGLVYMVIGYTVHFLSLFVCAIVGAILGMVGDLFASAIKRYYGIKDYGNLFPGHGGVLDRVDSALFTFPWVFLVHTVVSLIG